MCGILSGSEAAQILGTSTSAPTYANRLGLGISPGLRHRKHADRRERRQRDGISNGIGNRFGIRQCAGSGIGNRFGIRQCNAGDRVRISRRQEALTLQQLHGRVSVTSVAVGDYEKIENARRAASKQARHTLYYGSKEEHEAAERRHDELARQREQYLRDLLGQLTFRWYIAHAYTARETATYGGADHIVVDEPIRIGRLLREPGDALSRPKRKFLALYAVEEGRLPTSIADIKIAERIVSSPPAAKTTKKSYKQLDDEIDDVLRRR